MMMSRYWKVVVLTLAFTAGATMAPGTPAHPDVSTHGALLVAVDAQPAAPERRTGAQLPQCLDWGTVNQYGDPCDGPPRVRCSCSK